MFGFSPWIILGVLVMTLSVSGGAYFKGRADMYDREELKIADLRNEAAANAEADQEKRQKAFMDAANNYEVSNAQAKVRYRTITESVDRIVDRPVYRDRCIDDDGVRLAQLALSGVAVKAPDPSQPDAGMPDANAPR